MIRVEPEVLMSTENVTYGDMKRVEMASVIPDCLDDDLRRKRHTAAIRDRGWAWVVIFSVFMIHFTYDGVCFSLGIVLIGRPIY